MLLKSVLLGLTAERKHLPQVIKNKHMRMEQMEELETGMVLRNQQVAGSIPAGGSSVFNPWELPRPAIDDLFLL
jgi:hypothetical protein